MNSLMTLSKDFSNNCKFSGERPGRMPISLSALLVSNPRTSIMLRLINFSSLTLSKHAHIFKLGTVPGSLCQFKTRLLIFSQTNQQRTHEKVLYGCLSARLFEYIPLFEYILTFTLRSLLFKRTVTNTQNFYRLLGE